MSGQRYTIGADGRRYVPAAFWRHVNKTETCWLWTGCTDKGYGKYSREAAHRTAYLMLVGPIPEGLELDHLCVTPLCVNPAHLEPVTRAENARRRAALRTHCPQGHLFDEKNTAYQPHGARRCRACSSKWAVESKRRAAARRKAVAA